MTLIEINKLIDLAVVIAKSDYHLAEMIHAPKQRISDWRKGRQPMPAGDVALVAEIAGLDAVAWCARSVAEGYKSGEKGDAVCAALKKALAATGAVIATDGNTQAIELIRCAKSKVPKLRYVVRERLTREASRSGVRGVNRTRRGVDLGLTLFASQGSQTALCHQ